MKKFLIAIAGPTASGKTAISIELAKHFRTEIISADSRQFYRELNIGAAKPAAAQLNEVSHHFIGHISIHDSYNAGKFETDALKKMDQLFVNHDVVILTGGSGLFVKAVLEGLDEIPEVDEQVKKMVRQWFREKGIPFLQEKLQEADPVYFQKMDSKNPVRLMRALEIFYSAGKPFSSFHSGKKTVRPFNTVLIALDVPKEILHRQIDERVDEMMRSGLLAEAKNLFQFKDINALQTVGYSELFDYLEGTISLDEAISLIKQHTRNFAKRQLTWFKKMNHVAWLPSSTGSILLYVQNEMKRQIQHNR